MVLGEIVATGTAVLAAVPLMIIVMKISAWGARCQDERRSARLEREIRRMMDEDVRREWELLKVGETTDGAGGTDDQVVRGHGPSGGIGSSHDRLGGNADGPAFMPYHY
jgi:hypothetical protein